MVVLDSFDNIYDNWIEELLASDEEHIAIPNVESILRLINKAVMEEYRYKKEYASYKRQRKGENIDLHQKSPIQILCIPACLLQRNLIPTGNSRKH